MKRRIWKDFKASHSHLTRVPAGADASLRTFFATPIPLTSLEVTVGIKGSTVNESGEEKVTRSAYFEDIREADGHASN